jgi:hypothetical protein
MKITMKTKILLLASLILIPIYMTSQITIGSPDKAEEGALLDLKSNNNVGVNSIKGLGIPRVVLSQLDELYPMYGAYGAEAPEYTSNKATLKKKHTGLTVYNITDDGVFVPGFYFWDGDKWFINELMATPLPSIDELFCNSFQMYPSTYAANTDFRCIFTVPYVGGNGGKYTQFDDGIYINPVASDGTVITTFNIKVAPGTLAIGNGQLILIGEGQLPSTTAPYTVNINIFGQSCSFTINKDETQTAVLRYRSGTFMDVNTSSTTGEVALGNLAIRFNNGYYEYKILGPTGTKDNKVDISWVYRKSGAGHGYGVYGRAYPVRETWNSIASGVVSVGRGSNNAAGRVDNGNINLANRDVAIAHFFIQTDASHDVYRVTFNANVPLAAGTYAPATTSAVSIIVERLEDHGDGN